MRYCWTLLALISSVAAAQAVPAASADDDTTPVLGFNATLSDAGQNNSATGWSDVLTPSISWRFNRYISVDAGTPIFPIVSAYVTNARGTQFQTQKFLLGDTGINGHLENDLWSFHNELTGTIGLASGNQKYGLGAGTTTWNVTNHLERSFGFFNPDIEFGIGNSSSLNGTVRRAYVSVGKIANFQAGATFDLPLRLSLDVEAYEDLPVSSQNVYGTITRKTKNGTTRTVTTLQGSGSAEDNGISTEFDVPLPRKLRFAFTYEHSIIQNLNSTSFGLTWTLRSPKAN